MPCCQSQVILKKSSLGTQFFAHKRVGSCNIQPESREHLFAKDTIARAAVSAGWDAATESRADDLTPAWIADVLCTRSDRSAKVAFEVQWTRQTVEETRRRQSMYRDSGIRALWLMRQQDPPPISKDTPAFRLVLRKDVKEFDVWLPGERYYLTSAVRMRRTDRDWGQRVALHDFVRGALRGALKFDPLVNCCVDLSIRLAAKTCYKCRKQIRVLDRMTVQGNSRFAGIGTFSFSLSDLEDSYSDAERWIQRELPPARLQQYAVGAIKRRFSRTMNKRYISNGCIHCEALQGKFYEYEVFDNAPTILDARIELTRSFLDACDGAAGLRRWWFDEKYAHK